ncbi:MAG: hypothetical protein R2697_19090 [Ilumatobacteraceae bacterium]
MNAAVRLHVERTADPAVLRWVVHDPTLAEAGDGPRAVVGDGALAAVIADVTALDVSVRRGDVLVRVADPAAWPRLASTVHAAIATDVAARAPWLTTREATVTPSPSARRSS